MGRWELSDHLALVYSQNVLVFNPSGLLHEIKLSVGTSKNTLCGDKLATEILTELSKPFVLGTEWRQVSLHPTLASQTTGRGTTWKALPPGA